MNTSNRLTSLRGLRTFCIAAECASFRDAAERLYITASAVSHQIKSLEEEFGTFVTPNITPDAQTGNQRGNLHPKIVEHDDHRKAPKDHLDCSIDG